ncbi:MAG: hypothetical protein AB1758_02385, partial [Candidatus Eremiobacterota bacterium]
GMEASMPFLRSLRLENLLSYPDERSRKGACARAHGWDLNGRVDPAAVRSKACFCEEVIDEP